jgi:tetratricopeptide (TPR) repeat protein
MTRAPTSSGATRARRTSPEPLWVASLTPRLGPALWAHLVRELGLEHADRCLARWLDRGLLRPAGGDLVWVDEHRRALSERFAWRAPPWLHAARCAIAEHVARRGDEGDLAEAIDQFVLAGERDRALRVLRRLAPELLDRGREASLLAPTARLLESNGPVPIWLAYLHALALERRGELARAATCFAEAATRRAERSPSWVPRPGELHASAGLVELRLGQVQRAELSRDAARLVVGPRGSARLAQLEARLCLARGRLDEAEQHFDRAAQLATRAHDAAERAEAISGLGVVAMRRGQPRVAVDHYRRALAESRMVPGLARTARILANHAGARVMLGDWGASAQFEQAAELRERIGDLAGAANSTAGAALAREGAGQSERALADLDRARRGAESGGDPALAFEIRLLRACVAARCGEATLARAELKAAELLRRRLEQPDPLLEGLVHEAQAELAFARRDGLGCLRAGRRALAVYRAQRAHQLSARVHLLLARNAHAQRRRGSVAGHLRATAARLLPSEARLPTAWASRDVLEQGQRSPSSVVRALCAHLLEQPSAPESNPSQPERSRIVDRSGARSATDRQVAELRAAPPEVLVDLPRATLVVRGVDHSLDARRVLVPLLAALVGASPEPVEAESLHREIWGVDRFDAAARTRLKVAVSRARSLLGREAIATRTTRSPSGAPVTSYALGPRIELAILEGGKTSSTPR